MTIKKLKIGTILWIVISSVFLLVQFLELQPLPWIEAPALMLTGAAIVFCAILFYEMIDPLKQEAITSRIFTLGIFTLATIGFALVLSLFIVEFSILFILSGISTGGGIMYFSMC